MGLDVYVGSVTRYHCGDWQTVVQKFGSDTGLDVQVTRHPESPDAITDPTVLTLEHGRGRTRTCYSGAQKARNETNPLRLEPDLPGPYSSGWQEKPKTIV